MKRERNEIKPRLMGITELMNYLSIGRAKAAEVATNAGACKRLGKRVLYDVKLIDSYIDTL